MDLLGNRIEEANMDLKITRANSLDSAILSQKRKLVQAISDEELLATGRAKLSIQPQPHQPHRQDDDELATAEPEHSQKSIQSQQQRRHDDEELARKTHMLTMKDTVFKYHPDILRVIKKKELGPDGQEQYLKDYGADDIDSGDEELIHVPADFKWRKMCIANWHVDDLVSKIRAQEWPFEIYTAGFVSDDGKQFSCGAIISDSCQRPIVASCKVITDTEGKCPSQFRLELEGVALGVKLAKKYEIYPFYIFCPSEEVPSFVLESEAQRRYCYCTGERVIVKTPCETCSQKWILLKDHEDREEALKIVQNIFFDTSELEGMGVWYELMSGTSASAISVAKLLKNQELKIEEIGASPDLWATIYEEVFGQYTKLEPLERSR